MEENNNLVLKVTETLSKDVGHGIARIDPQSMSALEVGIGDIVEIEGIKKSIAKVMPIQSDLRGMSIIQIDGYTRESSGVTIGENVSVKKIECEKAKRVNLLKINAKTKDANEEEGIYISRLIDGLALLKGNKIRANLMGSLFYEFMVESTEPEGAVIVTHDTKIKIINSKEQGNFNLRVTYEDIGGLGNEMLKIREMIEWPLKHPNLFEKLGIDAPKGVLLHGAPGTGKTLIAKAIANETDSYFVSINGPEIIHKFYGESEAKLREIFDKAVKNAPSIIFIDEIDAIAPKREETKGDVEKRVVAQLLTLMDGIRDRGRVMVIGATNIPNSLDPALRRPGRFDREIQIGIPDVKCRMDILNIHTRGMPLGSDVDIKKLSELTGGFVGADLNALCREAAMITVRDAFQGQELSNEYQLNEIIFHLSIPMNNFMRALCQVEPSVIRDVIIEAPDVSWQDVGGLGEVKQYFKEIIEWPFQYREIYDYVKANVPKGILLYGAPGTGKTLLAKALANELGFNFLCVKSSELMSKWYGESEKNIRQIFKKAREAAPSIIFFDEIDCLMKARGTHNESSDVQDRITSQVLIEMDGVQEMRDVIVMGATNRIQVMDEALLRSGRFDIQIEVGKPDCPAREEIFKIHLEGRPLEKDLCFKELGENTAGLSGADIKHICDEAALLVAKQCVTEGLKLEEAVITTSLLKSIIDGQKWRYSNDKP
ncbi:transitional endoplasmic reticulum ATPase [Lachnotalea glycerini]|uniref:AAA family ATPase n=1 Tax=Lachnotalea glycerini TaxID=1763509 RepID=A0A255I9F2_9FIRM|nr:CDC48 family AAA ATPase [Lachnotalea glycerini]PXV85957.1 transitional endoplasmic reticulum ATPase [Lachnotalea glycerini]RDY31393.1 AAA family ATPase [Lachnotalea glycerini]